MFHDSALTSEQRMIRELLEGLSRDFPYSYFLKRMREKRFPEEFFQAFAQTGLLGLEVPEPLGGSQGTVRDFAVLFYFLGRYGFFSFHLLEQFVSAFILAHYGNSYQKEVLLPRLLQGERIALYLLEDPAGEEPFPVNTLLTPEEDHYRLSGRKLFVSCAQEAPLALIAARVGEERKGSRATSVALVTKPALELKAKVEIRDVNIRVVEEREERQITGDLFCHTEFSGVKVQGEEVVPIQGKVPYERLLHRLFLGIASGFLGIADSVIEKGVNWANQRVIFTEPIASYQAIQHPFVRAKTEVEMGKLLVERAVEAEAEPYSPEEQLTYAQLARYQSLAGAFQAFDISMQAHGGGAFDRDTGILPYWTLLLIARSYLLREEKILEGFGEVILKGM